MNIKPLNNLCLLEPMPQLRSTVLDLVIPDKFKFDQWEWRVLAVGPKVSPDIQPGMRVLIDPNLLDQRNLEHEGKSVKLVPAGDIQMLIGVAAE